MARNSESQRVHVTPHSDGEKENIINDPTASAGATIGIQVSAKMELGQERNPYNFIPEADPEMKKFEKLMRGSQTEE